MPVLVADCHGATAWGRRNGFFVLERRDLAEDFTALSGLDVIIRTDKPFAGSAEMAFAMGEVARFVTLVDHFGRQPADFVSSMRAVTALTAA